MSPPNPPLFLILGLAGHVVPTPAGLGPGRTNPGSRGLLNGGPFGTDLASRTSVARSVGPALPTSADGGAVKIITEQWILLIEKIPSHEFGPPGETLTPGKPRYFVNYTV